MTIPYNEAGQAAFDVFYRIAEKLYAGAQAATSEYISQNFPRSQTLEECHADGKYHRMIRTEGGENKAISYDYRTKEIEAA